MIHREYASQTLLSKTLPDETLKQNQGTISSVQIVAEFNDAVFDDKNNVEDVVGPVQNKIYVPSHHGYPTYF